MNVLRALSWAALAAHGLAQFITPPNETVFTTVQGPLGIQVRYKQVATGPGTICELHPNVTSYSGYVDISPHEHYHFWFFGARNVEPTAAHLTAWISGGPGASAMSELTTEHGPCRITEQLQPTYNPYSWNTNSNVVYIDQPSTVGFSYTDAVPAYIHPNTCAIKPLNSAVCPKDLPPSNDCGYYGSGRCGTFPLPKKAYSVNSTEAAAPLFWLALQGIFAAFPQYAAHGFTLGSESYGGHFAPVFSRYIAQQNANLPAGAVHIPQQSIQVNNGWYDPVVAYAAFYDFLVYPGNTYGLKLPNATDGQTMYNNLHGADKCLQGIAACNAANGTDAICEHWDNYCTNHVQLFLYHDLNRGSYDTRELNLNPFPNGFYIDYLNTPRVLKELGAFVNYTDQSVLISNQFDNTGDDAKELGITQALANLLDSGVSVTLMAGDSDYDCNWFGGRNVTTNIANLSTTTGLAAAYAAAGWANLTTPDGIVHGQVKQAGRLSFTRVYESGHQVGFFQPLAEQAIYNRSIAGLDIATGSVNVTAPVNGLLYRSTGPAESTYYNGNATVQFRHWPANALYDYATNQPTLSRGTGTSSNIGGRP